MFAKPIWFALVLALFTLAVAGCRTTQNVATTAARTIEVQLGDLYVKPTPIKVKAGETVAFKLINEGQLAHEFMVGHEVDVHEGRPETFEKDFFKGVKITQGSTQGKAMIENMHGTMVSMEGNSQTTITLTVPKERVGEWEIACFLPGHYESGMKGSLIVE